VTPFPEIKECEKYGPTAILFFLMFVVTILAARWIVRRLALPSTLVQRSSAFSFGNALSGRKAIQVLCKKDGKKFRVSSPRSEQSANEAQAGLR